MLITKQSVVLRSGLLTTTRWFYDPFRIVDMWSSQQSKVFPQVFWWERNIAESCAFLQLQKATQIFRWHCGTALGRSLLLLSLSSWDCYFQYPFHASYRHAVCWGHCWLLFLHPLVPHYDHHVQQKSRKKINPTRCKVPYYLMIQLGHLHNPKTGKEMFSIKCHNISRMNLSVSRLYHFLSSKTYFSHVSTKEEWTSERQEQGGAWTLSGRPIKSQDRYIQKCGWPPNPPSQEEHSGRLFAHQIC